MLASMKITNTFSLILKMGGGGGGGGGGAGREVSAGKG
jgi:hypothetical protein